jgi:site-specific recombinase XerD
MSSDRLLKMVGVDQQRLDLASPHRGRLAFAARQQRHEKLGKLPPNFGKRYPPEPLTPAEIKRLVDAIPSGSLTGKRDRAMIVLLWRSGLRITEALELRERDLNHSTGTIRIRRGRNGKSRTVGMDDAGWAAVRLWLAARATLDVAPDAPVFCLTERGKRGLPWRDQLVRGMLKRRASKAGITRRVHPHGFRHTFAVELAQEGVPLHHIQRLLGHSSLDTTAVYLAGIHPAETIEVVRARQSPWQLGDAA